MATTVRITETYDMKTSVGKLGIIGIHTPTASIINRMYSGLMNNHRFIRFKKCDVVGACASVLPADPQQVGVESGDVAPEDMFNPILYRAVTNTAFDTLVSRIYDPTAQLTALGSVSAAEIADSVDNFKIYYSLLAEHGRWKKSMPQRGFAIKGLYPLCHTVVSSFGNIHKVNTNILGVEDGDGVAHDIPDLMDVNIANDALNATSADEIACTFRGKSVKMPKIPLHYIGGDAGVDLQIPKTFVACLIVPPARLHEFYYRMRVTWTISFENPIPKTEYSYANQIANVGDGSYYKSYTYESSKTSLDSMSSSVDANDVSINKIMES